MPPLWADTPYSLISTQPFSKDVILLTTYGSPCGQNADFLEQDSHSAYYVATQMALAHNGILRGLNAMYLQATNIPSKDLETIRDFLTYCQRWCESMHHHHDAEETKFFPDVELLSGVKGLMTSNVEQHRAFTPGFDLFYEYSMTCPPKDYNGQRLVSLIEGFADPLTRHLQDEIDTLRALNKYDSVLLRKAYNDLEKLLMATDNVSLLYDIDTARGRYFQFGDMTLSTESPLLFLALQTGPMKEPFITSLPCLSLCLTLFTTGLDDGIEARGDSTHAQYGKIAGSWRLLTGVRLLECRRGCVSTNLEMT